MVVKKKFYHAWAIGNIAFRVLIVIGKSMIINMFAVVSVANVKKSGV